MVSQKLMGRCGGWGKGVTHRLNQGNYSRSKFGGFTQEQEMVLKRKGPETHIHWSPPPPKGFSCSSFWLQKFVPPPCSVQPASIWTCLCPHGTLPTVFAHHLSLYQEAAGICQLLGILKSFGDPSAPTTCSECSLLHCAFVHAISLLGISSSHPTPLHPLKITRRHPHEWGHSSSFQSVVCNLFWASIIAISNWCN